MGPRRGPGAACQAALALTNVLRVHCAATLTLTPPQVLHEKGFLYDRCAACVVLRCAALCRPAPPPPARSPLPPLCRSTLIEGKGYSLSYGMGERVWPCERGQGREASQPAVAAVAGWWL